MDGFTFSDSRILIVDDDQMMLLLARHIVAQAGCRHIEGTTEPLRTLELCRSHVPDVLLLDLRMPDIDGFAVMQMLQAAQLEAPPAIIILTGEDGASVRTEAYERGARDYVTKPFNARELIARVANAAEAVQLTRRLEAAVAERTQKLDKALSVLRQAEGELGRRLARSEAESRSKSGLLAETVHELRTPLNAILGYAEAMKGELFGPMGQPRYLEHAQTIHTAGAHLLKLVDGLLDLSAADVEETLDLGPVDIGAVIRETADLLKPIAEEGHVRLAVTIDPALALVHTDGTKLRQVILNLGSNAVKYTPKGGRVTIEAKPDGEGGALVLVIRDTGIGIAPEHMDLIMKPFGRTPGARASGVKGTGLGLPLTRRYIAMLGGSLDIQSTPGKGTVVSVRLPADPKSRQEPPVAATG